MEEGGESKLGAEEASLPLNVPTLITSRGTCLVTVASANLYPKKGKARFEKQIEQIIGNSRK